MSVKNEYFPHIIAGITTTVLSTVVWLIFAVPLMAFFVTDDPFGFPQFSGFLLNLIMLLVGINLLINFPLSRLAERLSVNNPIWRFLLPLGFLILAYLIYLMFPSLPGLLRRIPLLAAFTFLVYWLILNLTQRFTRKS